jgi:inner membrane protein
VDTVTQIALGAAVGELTMGRRVGKRAIAWGAVCGCLPDTDIFVPFADAVADFTYHRSATHSVFVLAALTPLMVWLILRVHPYTRSLRYRWALLVYAAFLTHVLLDCFTVYGTQVLWPVSMTPVAWSTVFIIDPLYTLPLLVGVIAALAYSREELRGHRLNTLGLALSTAYLAWGVAVKLHVEDTARASLARAGVQHERLLSTPTPFNSLLWRVITVGAGENTESFYSLLDTSDDPPIVRRPSAENLLEPIASQWPVARLRWFTRGFYSVGEEGGRIVITDLRMGVHPFYAFRFAVAATSNPHPLPIPSERLQSRWQAAELRAVLHRIWSPDAWPPP